MHRQRFIRIAYSIYCLSLLAACEPPVDAPPPLVATVTARFDPTATPPVVPAPNDLAFVGGDGVHLNIPDQPSDSPAQRALNAYLRGLTGFPSSSVASASFSGPLDAKTVTDPVSPMLGAVLVVDLTTQMLVGPGDKTVALAPDGTTITITPSQRWPSGHRFAVLVFGGSDPTGLRGANGEPVIASPAFFFLRAPDPLVARCLDRGNPACVCPATALADANDRSCHSIVQGLDDATAKRIEPQRAQFAAVLGAVLPLAAPGRSESNLVLFWTFTITAQPMTVFDPTRGEVPFPNDVLIDQATGRVNLPIAPGDPQAALKMELNQLDGFSTSAPETVAVDTAGVGLDAATVSAGRSVLLINLDPTLGAVQPIFAASAPDGQVAVEPLEPLLPDQNRYAVVVTGGVTDAAGRALVPPPTTALIVQDAPLFDGTHSTVSLLSDQQALELEALRAAVQPLVARLGALGIARQQIAALWTFTTQSINRPLAAVDELPTRASLPTDVSVTKTIDAATLAGINLGGLPVSHIAWLVLGSFTSRIVWDPATHLVTFARQVEVPMLPQADRFSVILPPTSPTVTIKFWLAVPKTPPGIASVPVSIVQHGLTSWRGNVLLLADNLAQAGWASVAFDIDFHGSRSHCTADSQCRGGAAGSCDLTTGACANGFVPKSPSDDPLVCVLAPLSGDPNDCNPLISGQGALDAHDLFATRSNAQQFVVDAAQLVRVLTDALNPAGLHAQLAAAGVTPPLDAARIGFVGHSLGALGGAVFLAIAAEPRVGVLNAGGGHPFEILANGAFHSIVDQSLQAAGIMRGTPQYAQLVATARWVIDPVDPFSVGPNIVRRPALSYVTGVRNSPKPVIVQETGMDVVVPPQYQEALAFAVFGPSGLDAMHHALGRTTGGSLVSTYFATGVHGTFLTLQPMDVGISMRTQAFSFLATFGAVLPAP
jgi:hypothetical protein